MRIRSTNFSRIANGKLRMSTLMRRWYHNRQVHNAATVQSNARIVASPSHAQAPATLNLLPANYTLSCTLMFGSALRLSPGPRFRVRKTCMTAIVVVAANSTLYNRLLAGHASSKMEETLCAIHTTRKH